MKRSEAPTYIHLDGPMIDINCGDGRSPVGNDVAPYAKIFGGRPALAWHAMAIAEFSQPESVQQSLTQADAEFETQGLYKKASINGGVHSDEHSEGKGAVEIDPDVDTDHVGCGRWQKGKQIAQASLQHIEVIGHEIQQQAPDLISASNGLEELRGLANANARLAKRMLPGDVPVLPSGRSVVLSAMEHGSGGIVLEGDHKEEQAWYNLAENKTNDNFSTPHYFGADGWVVSRFFAVNKDRFGIDERLALLQDVLIAKATRLVLANTSQVDGINT